MKARLLLMISNLLLVGAVSYLLVSRPGPSVVKNISESRAIPAATADGPAISPAPQASAAGPFRWSQVESTNYLTYIANLRAIGCPEPTIRDIIAADLHGQYDQGQTKVHEPQPPGTGIVARPASSPARREEAEVLDQLLSTEPERTVFADGSNPELVPDRSFNPTESTSSQTLLFPGATRGYRLPLAFVDPDPAVKLDDKQSTAIQDLRKNFVDALSDPGRDAATSAVDSPSSAAESKPATTDSASSNPDPADPGTGRRWQTAQWESDQRFKALFGWQAFVQRDIRAAQQAWAAQSPESSSGQ